MDITRSQQLKDIIELSKAMLARARDNEWALVAELEVRRKQLVVSCFQTPTAEQDAPEVATLITEILKLNQEVTELGRRCQEQLGSEIRTQNVGRAASAAYLSHAR